MGYPDYGDIILVDFNPVIGKEIAKVRPCIVVSCRLLNKKSPFLIVVPVTGSVQKSLPFHILVSPSKTNGLSKNSKILPEQIKSLSKERFVKKVGRLEKKYLQKLAESIRFVLNEEH